MFNTSAFRRLLKTGSCLNLYRMNRSSDLCSSLCRKWRQEVRPCDHVSHEERQIYQTSIPWCWISFASLRGREQNIYKPLLFRTNGEHRFYSIKVDGPPAGQKAGSGLLWGKSSNPDFWNYQFCRTLTDTGGMYKNKTIQSAVLSVPPRLYEMHIYHSVIWWWYDWMYRRWLALYQ